MSDFVAALAAAVAVFLAAWWGQPGRKAIGIRRYVELLNDLPEDSSQRVRLAAEIDKMIDGEIDGRRFNEALQMAWAILVSFAIALLTTSMARSLGGAWWVASIAYWVLTGASVAGLIVGLWQRWKQRESSSSEQENEAR